MNDEPVIRVLGVGNVLTSDDGVGPTVIKIMESKYRFPNGVEVIDVGTPGLDFTPFLSGAASVIVVDAVHADGGRPGEIRLWRDDELLKAPPVARTNPHEPGLREALMATELTDSSPRSIVLIGVVPASLEAGTALSVPVADAVPEVERRVFEELERLGISPERREDPAAPDLWWV